jgi:hypothetical protein
LLDYCFRNCNFEHDWNICLYVHVHYITAYTKNMEIVPLTRKREMLSALQYFLITSFFRKDSNWEAFVYMSGNFIILTMIKFFFVLSENWDSNWSMQKLELVFRIFDSRKMRAIWIFAASHKIHIQSYVF